MNKEKVVELLSKYLPEGYEEMIADWLFEYPIFFKIVKPRTTKLGDFTPSLTKNKSKITINGDLNKYSFLITSIHEFAHFFVFLKYGIKVLPHGEEWKEEYRKLIIKILDKKLIPKDIEIALINSLTNTKASSCSDLVLNRTLKKYDSDDKKQILLEDIPNGTHFWLLGKLMKKGDLRRKRYICDEINTNKRYLVHQLAEIKLYEKK